MSRACPRTGRTRATSLSPDAVRPSDMLVAFFAPATVLLAVAAAVGVAGLATGSPDARWLALHVAFLGGVSQLVLGAAQFFVCAFLATDPPPRRLLRAQLASWNAGVVLIAVGVPADVTALTGAGGALILVGLALFTAALRGMQRRSLQRAPWAARWYLAAAGFLAAGAVLGPLMAADVAWTNGSLLGAHLALNLAGWFGAAIVGTLHTFYPSLTETRLRWPRLQAPTFACWCAGVAVVALGCAFGLTAVAAAGWALLAAGGLLVGANLVASALTAQRQTPAGIVVGAAQALLPGALVAALVITVDGGAAAALVGEHREIVAILAVAGWIGLTVLGSLLHLLTLMARVRGGFARRGPAAPVVPGPLDVALPAAAVVAADALAAALVAGLAPVAAGAGVVLVVTYLVLGARVAAAAVRAIRVAPLRI